MRARRSLPLSLLPSLGRRLGGTVLGLSLALALAASPAVSAPHAAPPAKAAAGKARGSTAKRSTKRSAKRSTKRKGSSARAASHEAKRAEPTAPAIPTIPELPAPDVFAALPGAEPAAASPAPAAAAVELPKPFAAFSRSAGGMLDALMDRARSQLGTRYVLGATSPGGALDCSAFTRFAMEALGLRLPRTAAQQAKVGVAVPRDRGMLRPGDLLTFGRGRRVSHVGIYLGEGRFIHASVKSGQVIETTFAKNAQLLRRWLGARRLLADADSMPANGG